MPPLMTRKIRRAMRELGAGYARTGTLDSEAVARFAGPERLSPFARVVFTLLGMLGITDFYWNMNLKKHGAYARRFARPEEGKW